MPETETATHPRCADVARLVAAETALIEQAFARRAARALAELMPSTDHRLDRVFGRGVEVSARTLLVLAGLPADVSRMAPDDLGCSRTGADSSGQRRTVPNAAEQHRTEANG